ncbi:MAG: hypothetical protein ACXVAB_08425 [Thermodesulfobacteriota bacterium]
MRRLLIAIMALSLMIMPFAVYGQLQQSASGSPPPVSQQLVPEGDFALKLVNVLKLGTPSNEAQAEDMLSSVGIAPKNGWIADYPMTPIIIGEVHDAIAAAADAHKLPMGRDDALTAFQGVTAEFGLAIVPGSPGQYAENQPQPNPDEINGYYYDEGPPIITYYPPPWDYYYLYGWVPYPFWWGGFFFTGFFCLHDFHTFAFVDGHHHFISNHFVDPKTHAVTHVDPTTRTMGRTVNTSLGRTQHGFGSTQATKGATSIFNRSFERTNRGMTSSLGNAGRQNGMNFRQGQGRSFNNPNVTHERSFSTAPRTGGGSFSHPSQSFGASPRFSEGSRGFSSGHSSGGFSGGGFHGGGGSFGGFHGGGFSGGGGSHGGGGHR